MNLVLATQEEADQQFLMHYRTPGSKNGQRLYQNPDGSLTPEGYKHYAEMYGWGQKKRSELATESDADRKKREVELQKNVSKLEKQEAKNAKYIKKSYKYSRRAVNSARRARNMQDFAGANALTKAMDAREKGDFNIARRNYMSEKSVEAIFRQNAETKRLYSKSAKFQRKVIRGQKKLEKLRKRIAELMPEEAEEEKKKLKHAGVPTDLFDIVDELDEKQKQALYTIIDDILPDDWLDGESDEESEDEDMDVKTDIEHGDGELMHWRTRGSKNGVRRYQREDGSLTPEGYEHYKEMYGWGDRKKADGSDEQLSKKEQRTKAKEERRKAREEKERKRDEEAEARAEERRKIYEADEIMARVAAKQEEAKKRDEAAKLEKENRENEQKSIRSMSDDDLSKAINRLQQEKRYSELLNERANREKGPIAVMASKLFQDAAQDLGKKALTLAVDKLIGKAKESLDQKKGFKLGDFKDVDLYSLDSDKIQAVSQAFNNAAQIALNRWKIDHPGQDPNQQNNQNNNNGNKNQNQQNNSNKNQNQQNTGGSDAVEKPNGPDGQLSKNQRKAIAAAAKSGASAAELARRYGVSESTIYDAAGGSFPQKQASESTTGKNDGGQIRRAGELHGGDRPGTDYDSIYRYYRSDPNLSEEEARKKATNLYNWEHQVYRVVSKEEAENSGFQKSGSAQSSTKSDSTSSAKTKKDSGKRTLEPEERKLDLGSVKVPDHKESESMGDYWNRLLRSNGAKIKTPDRPSEPKLIISDVKTPERGKHESMSDYWDQLLKVNKNSYNVYNARQRR